MGRVEINRRTMRVSAIIHHSESARLIKRHMARNWQMNEKEDHNPTVQAEGECTRAVSRQIMFRNDNQPFQIILYLAS